MRIHVRFKQINRLVLFIPLIGIGLLFALGCRNNSETFPEPDVGGGEVVDEEFAEEPPISEELPSAPSLDALLVTAVNAMRNGQIAFNPPEQMQANITEEITARIIDSQTEEATQALVDGLEESGSEIQIESLSVSSEMRAELVASDPSAFEITSKSSSQQIVIADEITEWQWDVTPLRRGDAKLILRVTAIIEASGFAPKSRALPVLEREINVSINPSYSIQQFLAQNWWWLILLLIVLAVLFVYMRQQKKTIFLVLGANPDTTGGIREDKEIEAIDNAIQSATYRNQLELEKHFAVKFADVDDLIRRYDPKIVHFSGHGSDTYDLIFEGRGMFHDTVSSDELVKLFERVEHNISCVVLNACFSKPLAEAISDHVGCVIGTSRELGDQTAIQFSTEFYKAIANGATLGHAYKSASDLIASQANESNSILRNEGHNSLGELQQGDPHTPKLIIHSNVVLEKQLVRSGWGWFF